MGGTGSEAKKACDDWLDSAFGRRSPRAVRSVFSQTSVHASGYIRSTRPSLGKVTIFISILLAVDRVTDRITTVPSSLA